MKAIKKVFILLLCITVALTICACGKKSSASGGGGGGGSSNSSDDVVQEIFTVSEEDAKAKCETFFEEIISGNLEDINEMLPFGTMLYSSSSEIDGGIMLPMFENVSYTIKNTESLDDGSMLITLEIENVDLKELLLSLPDDISSKEEAREKMKELMPTAARKTFEAEIYVVSYGDDTEPEIIITPNFANALTGGINDIIAEFFAEETTNEEID